MGPALFRCGALSFASSSRRGYGSRLAPGPSLTSAELEQRQLQSWFYLYSLTVGRHGAQREVEREM